jgi:hypothetical protein
MLADLAWAPNTWAGEQLVRLRVLQLAGGKNE